MQNNTMFTHPNPRTGFWRDAKINRRAVSIVGRCTARGAAGSTRGRGAVLRVRPSIAGQGGREAGGTRPSSGGGCAPAKLTENFSRTAVFGPHFEAWNRAR